MDLSHFLLLASCGTSLVGAVFSLLAYLSNRRLAHEFSLVSLGKLLRDETELLRRATEDQSRGVREELANLLAKFQEAIIVGFGSLGRGINEQIKEFSSRLDSGILSIETRADGIASKLDADIEKMRSEAVANRDNLRGIIEQKLDQNLTGHADTARILKDELSNSFHRLGASVNDSFAQSSQLQSERLGNVNDTLSSLTERLEKAQEGVRATVEARLEAIRNDNAAKLEQMRATVDEKLHDTLEQRLNNSFKQVSDQLEQVFRGLGEMQSLATGVGDLKRMMTNVRARGTWGEVTLASILEQAMAPDQYEKNVEIRPASNQRVEFSIKLPGGEGGPLWLPIDAKFPTEDYERLIDASERGDVEVVDLAGKALETRIRHAANDIATKYIHPPFSTDFGILFLPTEGLYAEVIRRPGLSDYLQRENRILVTGPTTLLALLNSLRMGFKTLAIQKRSSEVWQILGAVKTEFNKYGTIIDSVQKKLQEASNTIDKVSTRKRAIDRKLRSVEMLPEVETAELLASPNSDEPDPSSIEELQSVGTDS
ncbi:DNA recombination protein RmuC [Bradyrhizobium sp. WSM1743]|uniref:DNA recombination protein RmuC n=1 Tax=Bradyrhizobium sp. WSM1743 TaxID=318996 RepID=UPI0018DBDF75|nr:DNA recombination protein RmuC [Bradyrhizobium sp. WSM1743]